MTYTFVVNRKLQINSSKLELTTAELTTADLNEKNEYKMKVNINFVYEAGTQSIQRGPGYLVGEPLSPYSSTGDPIDMPLSITYGISGSREYDPDLNSILDNICFKIFSNPENPDPPTTDVKLF